MCCNVKDGCCGKGCKCVPARVGHVLIVIGAINWGIVGLGMLFGGLGSYWNVVHMILGGVPVLEAIVYVLVGVAGIMAIFGCRCKKCMGGVCKVHGAKMDGDMASKM